MAEQATESTVLSILAGQNTSCFSVWVKSTDHRDQFAHRWFAYTLSVNVNLRLRSIPCESFVLSVRLAPHADCRWVWHLVAVPVTGHFAALSGVQWPLHFAKFKVSSRVKFPEHRNSNFVTPTNRWDNRRYLHPTQPQIWQLPWDKSECVPFKFRSLFCPFALYWRLDKAESESAKTI